MDAFVFIAALAALGALALRFGQDSRDGIRSQEHEFAARGFTSIDRAPDRACSALPASGAAVSTVPAYPTLTFIEGGLGVSHGSLTASPDAARLEALARDLTAEYWGEAAWTTGIVPEASFRRILEELAPSLANAPVREAERAADAADRSPVAAPDTTYGPKQVVVAWMPTGVRLEPSGG